LHGSKHINWEMTANLHDLAAGQPRNIQGVLSDLMSITEMAHEHARVTGDAKPLQALRSLHTWLGEGKAFTLVKTHNRERGR
jgi:hypothetical protein